MRLKLVSERCLDAIASQEVSLINQDASSGQNPANIPKYPGKSNTIICVTYRYLKLLVFLSNMQINTLNTRSSVN